MTSGAPGFCDAVQNGDLPAAHAIVSEFLSTGTRWENDPSFGREITHLVEWLIKSGCIENVLVSEGMLKSEPPQKVLLLTTTIKGSYRSLVLKLNLGRHLKVHTLASAGRE